MNKRENNVFIHLVVWSLYITCNILITKLYFPGFDDYFGNIFEHLALILVFYLNAHFVIQRFGKLNSIPVLILLTTGLFWLYAGMLYVFQHYISPFIYGEPASDSQFRLFILGCVFNFLPYLGFSYGYSWFLRVLRKQRQINQLLIQQQKEREENLQLARERLYFEHSFLQAQINPHFLFNVLNFLYSRTLAYSTEVSGAIMKLAEIMRYALENEADTTGKVLLSREINHVRNVIDINQLRFNNKLNIDFQLQGNPGTHRIIPLVLVTLIENAFKHGELNDPDEALTITICISDQEKKFRCRIKNKKGKNTVEVSHGIGMQNIRNRLELNYRDNYSLDITDEQEFYSVDLQLNL